MQIFIFNHGICPEWIEGSTHDEILIIENEGLDIKQGYEIDQQKSNNHQQERMRNGRYSGPAKG